MNAYHRKCTASVQIERLLLFWNFSKGCSLGHIPGTLILLFRKIDQAMVVGCCWTVLQLYLIVTRIKQRE